MGWDLDCGACSVLKWQQTRTRDNESGKILSTVQFYPVVPKGGADVVEQPQQQTAAILSCEDHCKIDIEDPTDYFSRKEQGAFCSTTTAGGDAAGAAGGQGGSSLRPVRDVVCWGAPEPPGNNVQARSVLKPKTTKGEATTQAVEVMNLK